MKKLLISIPVIMLAVVAVFMMKSETEAESYGTVTIEVVNENGDMVIHDTLAFSEGDTLLELLQEHYTIGCADNSYNVSDVCEKTPLGGHVILQIDDVSTNWTNSYLAIYINDEYSITGIDKISLFQNSVYRFEYVSLGGGSE